MVANQLVWQDYEISVPTALTPQIMALGVEASAFEAGAAAMSRVTVPLPLLTDFPTPAAKAAILLESAAEIEHALLVQYLYAAYSLKDEADVSDAVQKTQLEAWRGEIVGIALQEMGHLMTVQNLLLFLGLRPNFEREDVKPGADLYPFPLVLQPLTRASLAKYVVAEAPWNAQGIDSIVELATGAAGSAINHVGILYGLMGLVLCTPEQVAAGATGHAHWDDIVRMIAQAAYDQAPQEQWHLHDDAFHPETVSQQGDPQHWDFPDGLRVHRVSDRAAAAQAIRDIGEQGEGPSADDQVSHFQRFLAIFSGSADLPGFPEPDGWVPAHAVPENPTIGGVTHPRTELWARLADARYGLLLGSIGGYLTSTGDTRDMFVNWIFAEMSALRSLAADLVKMPISENSTSRTGLTFTLPEQPNLPDDDTERWNLHRTRVTEAIAIAGQARAIETDPRLQRFLDEMLEDDRGRLESMSQPVV